VPLLVTAEDITSAIVRIDAAAQGVNDVFASCTQLDPGTKEAWSTWYAGWQQWAETNKDLNYFTLGLPAIGNQAVAYEDDIAGWQGDADRICNAQIPILQSQTSIANRNAELGGWSTVVSAIRWVAGAVIVALIVPPIVEMAHVYSASRRKPTQET
jgi:hypothetical protein